MSRVTSKGQVTIPKEIRDELGIQPGDELRFEATEEGVVLRKEIQENRFEKWRGVADTDESVPERMRRLRGEQQ